ncbi:MAG TPA: asparaginase [Propionibacteriaceae bacterium]|nr:asparaginase [Propionibacteriaceae bacterium]
MSTPLDADPILVDVVRGDLVETVHRGRLAVTAPDGSVVASLGAVDEPMYPRSSIKPLQAIAMLEAGLDTEGSELALAAASHRGEDFHLAGVRSILAGAGLTVADLQNTPDLPIGEDALAAWLRAGRGREPLAQNCSGKHASMVRTCVRAGWPVATYLEVDHPLQREIRRTIAEWCGDASHVTVDGCGAPLFAVPPTGLARAFGAIAAASDGPARRIADAYRAHPEYPSGTGTAEYFLHRAVPGLICKGGAEGCLAIGLADGTGIALKSDDGSHRGQFAVAVEVLVRLGAATREQLAAVPNDRVLGHGEPVGVVRAAAGALDEAFGTVPASR